MVKYDAKYGVELEDGEQEECRHVGCTYVSKASSPANRATCYQVHELNLMRHQYHFNTGRDECELCQNLISAGTWDPSSQTSVSIKAARESARKFGVSPAPRRPSRAVKTSSRVTRDVSPRPSPYDRPTSSITPTSPVRASRPATSYVAQVTVPSSAPGGHASGKFVLALECGIKSEVAWALDLLTAASHTENPQLSSVVDDRVLDILVYLVYMRTLGSVEEAYGVFSPANTFEGASTESLLHSNTEALSALNVLRNCAFEAGCAAKMVAHRGLRDTLVTILEQGCRPLSCVPHEVGVVIMEIFVNLATRANFEITDGSGPGLIVVLILGLHNDDRAMVLSSAVCVSKLCHVPANEEVLAGAIGDGAIARLLQLASLDDPELQALCMQTLNDLCDLDASIKGRVGRSPSAVTILMRALTEADPSSLVPSTSAALLRNIMGEPSSRSQMARHMNHLIEVAMSDGPTSTLATSVLFEMRG